MTLTVNVADQDNNFVRFMESARSIVFPSYRESTVAQIQSMRLKGLKICITFMFKFNDRFRQHLRLFEVIGVKN